MCNSFKAHQNQIKCDSDINDDSCECWGRGKDDDRLRRLVGVDPKSRQNHRAGQWWWLLARLPQTKTYLELESQSARHISATLNANNHNKTFNIH